jgi:predicted metal-binding membrane protein
MQEPLQRRDKWLIIGGLVILTMVAWFFTLYQAGIHAGMQMSASKPVRQHDSAMSHLEQAHGSMSMPGMSMPGMPMEPTAMPEASSTMALEAGLFLVMWVAMMVAMMFPSVYPMVLLFARVAKGQSARPGSTQVPTWVFVAGYLVIWTLVGGIMYALYLTLRWLGGHLAWFSDWATVGIAIVLMGAGLYQLSAWKGICLTHCRSPLSFVLHKWREGIGGAFLMGIDHGAYCVGCCWALMVVLFVMGLMSLVWMGGLTVVIFLEKVTRYGPRLSKVIGGMFILLGIAVLIEPALVQYLTT